MSNETILAKFDKPLSFAWKHQAQSLEVPKKFVFSTDIQPAQYTNKSNKSLPSEPIFLSDCTIHAYNSKRFLLKIKLKMSGDDIYCLIVPM